MCWMCMVFGDKNVLWEGEAELEGGLVHVADFDGGEGEEFFEVEEEIVGRGGRGREEGGEGPVGDGHFFRGVDYFVDGGLLLFLLLLLFLFLNNL